MACNDLMRVNAGLDRWVGSSALQRGLVPASPVDDPWRFLESKRLRKLGLGERRLQHRMNSCILDGQALHSRSNAEENVAVVPLTLSEHDDTKPTSLLSRSTNFCMYRNSTMPFNTMRETPTCGYYFDRNHGHSKHRIDVDPVNIVAWRKPDLAPITQLRDSTDKEKPAKSKPRRTK